MAKATCSNTATMVDMKIEQFCQSSSELLKSIHVRCNSGSSAKARKSQKIKAAKNVSIAGLTLDHDDAELSLDINDSDLSLDIDKTDMDHDI